MPPQVQRKRGEAALVPAPAKQWGGGGQDPLPLLTHASCQPAGKPWSRQTRARQDLESTPRLPQSVMQRDTPLRAMPTPTAAPVLVAAVAPSPCCHMQRYPMGTANLNSSSQPLSNPWPLSRVWQGDSDTYRHVTRATRVPPPTRTGRQLPPTRSSAPAAAPAGRQAGRVCPLPPQPWVGDLSPASCVPWEQAATHGSAHLTKVGHTPRAVVGGEGMLRA